MFGGRSSLSPGYLAMFLLAVMLWGTATQGAGPTEVLRIRYFSGPLKTRVVLDLSQPAAYELREVKNPNRLVINIPNGFFPNSSSIQVADKLVKRIRRNPGKNRAQMVVDLIGESRFKVFSLPADGGRPPRVVLDIFQPMATIMAKEPVVPFPDPPKGERLFTVVIDPGHGGLDPGAIRGGVQEKDVVLDVCLELARLLNQQPGYRALLTRERDYYPNLESRVQMARREKGDLFLSVHCNTHPNPQIRGMEVYFLSLRGATDREAQELADKENAADLVGLDHHQNPDDLVVSILMDMRMTQVLHQSARLARQLLGAADVSGVVESRKAKQAGFQVLKSLAMPSALVEISYLSNPEDFKILSRSEGRYKVARVLSDGILGWCREKEGIAQKIALAPTPWARRYAVRSGDNLWRLAQRHGTTVKEITTRNKLASQALMVGQLLRLPQGEREP